MALPGAGKPTEAAPAVFSRHWPVFASMALAVLAVILFAVEPWDPGKLPWSAINLTVGVSDLAGKLAPLAVAAAVIERAVEILISPWRDGEASKLSRAVDAVKAAAAKPPNERDAANLKNASDKLDDYRSQTQQYAFAISLALSVLASMAGVRALGVFFDPAKATAAFLRSSQYYFFNDVDMALSAALLAGGADGIHSVMNAITTFFDSTATKAENSAKTQNPANP